MEKTIRVTGKGKIAVKPDRTRVIIDMTDICSTYDGAISKSAYDIDVLKLVLAPLGFERSDIKTLHFSVDTEYESYYDKEKNWKRKFLGYKYTHTVKLEFDADNEMLGRVLYELSRLPFHPEFRINYTVKDTEAVKNELLAKAVEDSKAKAKVLTEAAGVTLGSIATIDYSWGEIDIISSPMGRCMDADLLGEADCKGYSIDIEPDDIDVSDTVTVVWNIG